MYLLNTTVVSTHASASKCTASTATYQSQVGTDSELFNTAFSEYYTTLSSNGESTKSEHRSSSGTTSVGERAGFLVTSSIERSSSTKSTFYSVAASNSLMTSSSIEWSSAASTTFTTETLIPYSSSAGSSSFSQSGSFSESGFTVRTKSFTFSTSTESFITEMASFGSRVTTEQEQESYYYAFDTDAYVTGSKPYSKIITIITESEWTRTLTSSRYLTESSTVPFLVVNAATAFADDNEQLWRVSSAPNTSFVALTDLSQSPSVDLRHEVMTVNVVDTTALVTNSFRTLNSSSSTFANHVLGWTTRLVFFYDDNDLLPRTTTSFGNLLWLLDTSSTHTLTSASLTYRISFVQNIFNTYRTTEISGADNFTYQVNNTFWSHGARTFYSSPLVGDIYANTTISGVTQTITTRSTYSEMGIEVDEFQLFYRNANSRLGIFSTTAKITAIAPQNYGYFALNSATDSPYGLNVAWNDIPITINPYVKLAENFRANAPLPAYYTDIIRVNPENPGFTTLDRSDWTFITVSIESDSASVTYGETSGTSTSTRTYSQVLSTSDEVGEEVLQYVSRTVGGIGNVGPLDENITFYVPVNAYSLTYYSQGVPTATATTFVTKRFSTNLASSGSGLFTSYLPIGYAAFGESTLVPPANATVGNYITSSRITQYTQSYNNFLLS